MDGNKDEAVKCLRIGKEALASGDKARALRFLSKARRLDPMLLVDDLLSSLDPADEPNGSDSNPADPPSAPELRARTAAASASLKAKAAAAESSSGDSARASAYTDEQVAVIRLIKKQKDYYQILGLERSCTVEDVRKAYRKLSLKVHPDKNKAPGAEEAFKAVSRAFQCLSNEESRKRYDLVGTDEPVQLHRAAARRGGHGFDGFNGFYEAEFDADEIFRNFFFGGMSPATAQFGTYRFRTGGMGGARGHHHVNPVGNSGLRTLIQVLPVILLLLLNFLPSSDPPYSLSRSYPYEVRLETRRGVQFYVKSRKFEEQYPPRSAERMALEDRIEREYVSIVKQNCRLELQRQQWGWGTQTPHCEMLRKYEEAAAA